MKKFVTYNVFSNRFRGQYVAMDESYSLEGVVQKNMWNRFANMGAELRDARIYDDGTIWARIECRGGVQVMTAWKTTGELVSWSVPLEDCGAMTGMRNKYKGRDLDVWQFVKTMDELSKSLNDISISETIKALELYHFKDTPDEFKVGVNESRCSIASMLARYGEDERWFDSVAGDDTVEVRVWKRELLQLGAALGGNALSQRETAWDIDPANDSTRGYKKDNDLAAYWYLMAAKGGDGLAANNLACYYADNNDCGKAKYWFDVGAKAGIPEAIKSKERCEKCHRTKVDHFYGPIM